MILQRLTLEDAATRLGFIDRRAAERWCRSHGITVCCEKRKKFVMNADLERVLQTNYIGGIKKEFPDKYQEIYKAWLNDDFLEIFHIMNDDTTVSNSSDNASNSTYIPKSKNAQDFLKNI
jgi:hypothetical protein